MQEDNIYPNDSSMLDAALTREDDRDKELKEIAEQYPKLQEAAARLEQQIAFYSSIHCFPAAILENETEFMHHVAAYKIVVTVLQQELAQLNTLISDVTQ